uniref:Uncharacterized protein n=1 Tax=Eutreptiella gymnastica TaxID=73025 RepID=A0A7S1IBQ0_9EUGL
MTASHVHDHEEAFKDLGEKPLLRREFPEALFIEDIWEKVKDKCTMNELQLMVYANAEHLLSVQGGNSNFMAFFGRNNIIYNKGGPETCCARWSAFSWYTRFGNSNVTVVRTFESLIEVINVRYNVTVQLLNGHRVTTQPGPMVGIRGRTLADPEPSP